MCWKAVGQISALVALALGLSALPAGAGHEPSGVTQYTGCRNLSTGIAKSLALGTAPLAPCPSGWTSFHVAGGDITAVLPGEGLEVEAGSSANGSVTLGLDFDPATQAELDALAAVGTINDSGNPVHWTKLKGVPAGLADGVDDTGGGGAGPDKVGYCDLVRDFTASYPAGPCQTLITTVDDPDVGGHTSLAIGVDGLPVISYWDSSAGALKVAHCNDAACTGGGETITTVDDPANTVGAFTSIAIGTDGLPVISYLDGNAFALKVAHVGS